MVSHKV